MKQSDNRLLIKIIISGIMVTGAVGAIGLSHSFGFCRNTTEKEALESVDNNVEVIRNESSSCSGFGLPNPADKYCLDMGYELESVEDLDGGQRAVCVFPDGTSCDTWAFLEGRCGRAFSICAIKGLDVVTTTREKNAFSKYTAICIDADKEVDSVPRLMGFDRLGKGVSLEEAAQMMTDVSVAPTVSNRVTAALPTSFDWRNENGQDWTTATKNQSQCGSCWAFSAVGAIETTLNIAADNPNLDPDLSEEYLVSDCPGRPIGDCCGGYHGAALELAFDIGIPDENCMPYDVAYYNTQACSCNDGCNPNCSGYPRECSHLLCDDACHDMNSRLTRIGGWTQLPANRNDIKNAIVNSGALSATLAMSGEFDANSVYRCTTCWDKNGDDTCDPVGQCNTTTGFCVSATGTTGNECDSDDDCDEDYNNDGICNQDDCLSNHAIVLVGYDDNNGYWIVKNSWGNTWNGDGYFKVGYDECHIEDVAYSVQINNQQSDCSQSNAVDLGAPGNNVTVSNNACVMVRGGYPTWWGTRDMSLQNSAPGDYPVPFEWENTCSGSSGNDVITGDWQNHVLSTTSDQCATLIDLQGNGGGTITLRYYGQ